MESSNSILSTLAGINPLILGLLIIWTLIWKGTALWRSARLGQRKWFIALLILNTLGILEIIYVFWISTKYQVEVVEE